MIFQQLYPTTPKNVPKPVYTTKCHMLLIWKIHHTLSNKSNSFNIPKTSTISTAGILADSHQAPWLSHQGSLDDGGDPCTVGEEEGHTNGVQLAKEQHAHVPGKVHLDAVHDVWFVVIRPVVGNQRSWENWSELMARCKKLIAGVSS